MSKLRPEQANVLGSLLTKPELRPHFFKHAKGLHWLFPLHEKGLFDPASLPKPEPAEEEGRFYIAPWPPAIYLSNIAEKLSTEENRKYAEIVWDIIKETTAYAKTNKFGNYHAWWLFVKVLSRLPIDILTPQEIDEVVGYWLCDRFGCDALVSDIGEKFLPALLNDTTDHAKKMVLPLIKQIYAIELLDKDDDKKRICNTRFRCDKAGISIRDITSNHAILMGQRLGQDAVTFFARQLEDVVKHEDNDAYSCMWHPAIENHKQNDLHDDPVNTLVFALRDVLLGFIAGNPKDSVAIVKSFLTGDVGIVQRVGVYAVDARYDVMIELTEMVLNDAFFGENFRHEMWHFLRNHYADMGKTNQDWVMDFISNLQGEGKYAGEEKYKAHRKAQWLSAIKDLDGRAAQIWKECMKTGINEPEHPDFACYSYGAKWAVSKSLYPPEQLVKLSAEALFETLNSYDGPSTSFDAPDLEGLCEAVKEVFKSVPAKYLDSFDAFLDLSPCFLVQIFSAYAVLWQEKDESLPWGHAWDALLNLSKSLVENDEFWAYKGPKDEDFWSRKQNYVPGTIAQLIESGVKSDDHAFDAALTPQARDIVKVMLEKVEGRDFQKASMDPLTTAINSPRGHCIEALINLALRACRLADRADGQESGGNDHKQVWSDHYEPLFNAEFERVKQGMYEFAALGPQYIVNFKYMSLEWTRESLPRFFNLDDETAWLCGMNAYAYGRLVDPEIYRFLRDNGHLKKALDSEDVRKITKDKIIENVTLSYLIGEEELGKPKAFIDKLIERRNPEELQHLVWFVWAQRPERRKSEEGPKDISSKVIKLWEKIAASVDLQSKEFRKVASGLCTWCSFIDQLSASTIDLLKSVCKYADVAHHSDDVLCSMERWVKESPLEVAEVYLEMTEGTRPFYPKESVLNIIEKIASSGKEGLRNARKIADVYIEKNDSLASDISAKLAEIG